MADDAAGTVTMTLAQPWGPFLPTIAKTWGSVMDKEWVVANGGWDGTCDTWQNFYAMTSADDPFTTIMNGTGAFMLDHWTPGQEIVLAKNAELLGRSLPSLTVSSSRSSLNAAPALPMLQAGDADIIDCTG